MGGFIPSPGWSRIASLNPISSGLRIPALNQDWIRAFPVLGWSTNITATPHQNLEIRAAFTEDSFGWDRAHPEIPTLSTGSGFDGVANAMIGSPASYSFQNKGKLPRFAGSSLTRGAHAVKWGVSYLDRWLNSNISALPAVNYFYDSAQDLLSGEPGILTFPASISALSSGAVTVPDNSRRYRYSQLSSYLQDSYRLTNHLLISVGLRYEYFSPPANVGNIEDSVLQLGGGPSMPARIQNIEVAAGQRIYASDWKNFAPRAGFAYQMDKAGTLVLRGSYGIFYDRPFDNLWLNVSLNDDVPASANLTGLALNPLNGITANLKLLFPNGVPAAGSCYSASSSILTVNCPGPTKLYFSRVCAQPTFRACSAACRNKWEDRSLPRLIMRVRWAGNC